MQASNEIEDLAELRAEADRQAVLWATCKRQDRCAEPYGSSWQVLIQDGERAGKSSGRCLCEEARQREVTLECDFSLSAELQQDGTWRAGEAASITFLPSAQRFDIEPMERLPED